MQMSNEQMDKMMNGMMQAMTDANKIVQDSMNAALQSATVMTKGYQEMCDNMNTMARNWVSQGTKVGQTMMGAKDVNDIMTTQSSMMQSTIESMMDDMNRMSQLSSRIAQEAAEPVANHMNAAMNATMNMMAARKAA